MIKILKYSSIGLLFASLVIYFSTLGPFAIFAIDGVWFMQIAVIAAFGAMMFYVKKLREEKKREPGQKYVDWFREYIQLQMSEKNKLAVALFLAMTVCASANDSAVETAVGGLKLRKEQVTPRGQALKREKDVSVINKMR